MLLMIGESHRISYREETEKDPSTHSLNGLLSSALWVMMGHWRGHTLLFMGCGSTYSPSAPRPIPDGAPKQWFCGSKAMLVVSSFLWKKKNYNTQRLFQSWIWSCHLSSKTRPLDSLSSTGVVWLGTQTASGGTSGVCLSGKLTVMLPVLSQPKQTVQHVYFSTAYKYYWYNNLKVLLNSKPRYPWVFSQIMSIKSLIPGEDSMLVFDTVSELELGEGKPSWWTYYALQLSGFLEVQLLQVIGYRVVVAFALLIVLLVLVLKGSGRKHVSGKAPQCLSFSSLGLAVKGQVCSTRL